MSMSVAPPKPVRRPLWRRFARFVLVAFFQIALFLVAGYFGVLWIVDARLQAALDDLERNHPGWRLADVEASRAVVPDDQNAAVVVLKAHALLPEEMFKKPIFESETSQPPQRLLRAEDAAALKKELDAAEPALIEARRLAAFQTGRYDITWEKFLRTKLDHLQKAREIANLLEAESQVQSQAGQPDPAWRASQAILGAARSIGDEPTLISFLVRVAIDAVATGQMERILGNGEVPAALLIESQELIANEGRQPLFRQALRGERAIMHDVFVDLSGRGGSLSELNTGKKSAVQDALGFPLARILGTEGHAWIMPAFSDYLEIAELPPSEQRIAYDKEARRTSLKAPLLARMLVPAVMKIAEADYRRKALAACAVTGLAVEQYRLKHGRWPEKLSDLVTTKLLSEVPLDPMDGKELRFRRTNDGVVVYTIGLDGKGDGGGLDAEPFDPEAMRPIEFRLWNVESRRQPPLPPRPKDGPDDGGADATR